MKIAYDLSTLSWTVEGYTPNVWMFDRKYPNPFTGARCIDVPPVPARVPGSVQRPCSTPGCCRIGRSASTRGPANGWSTATGCTGRSIPDEWCSGQRGDKTQFRLECLGLDYSGWVLVNGKEAGTFKGTHVPHVFDLTPHLAPSANTLEIVFDLPPRWLGQFGCSSR